MIQFFFARPHRDPPVTSSRPIYCQHKLKRRIEIGRTVARCLGLMTVVATSTTIRHWEISDYDVLYFVHLPLTGLYFLIYRMIISMRRSLNTMSKLIKEIKIQPLANFEARLRRSLILCTIYDYFIKLTDRFLRFLSSPFFLSLFFSLFRIYLSPTSPLMISAIVKGRCKNLARN